METYFNPRARKERDFLKSTRDWSAYYFNPRARKERDKPPNFFFFFYIFHFNPRARKERDTHFPDSFS